MRQRALLVSAVLLAGLAAVLAVQQRAVASHWRSLEHDRMKAASQRTDALSRQLAKANTSRDELQEQLDALAATEAANGDDAAVVSVLANRGGVVSSRLSTCVEATEVTPACAQAVDDARRILASLRSVAGNG